MSVYAWTYLFITLTFMLYLYIGWRARVRESSGFYVAGQGVPSIANGEWLPWLFLAIALILLIWPAWRNRHQ